MGPIIFILYLFGLFVLVLRGKFFTVEGVKKPLLLSFWILKLAAGVCIYVISTSSTPHKEVSSSKDFFESSGKLYWIHTRDLPLFADFMLGSGSNSEKYKEEAEEIGIKWYQHGENRIINDNRTVIRVNALLQFLSFRFYATHILFMCFLSFVGSVLLFKAFPKRGRKQIYAATVACFLVPSLLFWSVGVLKEPLLVLGLGGFLFYFRKIMNEFSPLTLLLLILSTLLLLCVKIDVFIVVLPMILVFFYCQQKRRFAILKYVAATVLLSGFCLLTHVLLPEKQIDAVHSVTIQNQQKYNTFDEDGKLAIFGTPHLDGSIGSLVRNTPLALYNSITQPFAYPMDSFLKICINLETVILILLLIICLIFGNYRRFARNNFAIFCTILSIYGFFLMGLTTHELGMFMRYKSIFLPFYVFGLIHLIDTDRVLSAFRIRKRKKDKDFDLVKSFEERMRRMAQGR